MKLKNCKKGTRVIVKGSCYYSEFSDMTGQILEDYDIEPYISFDSPNPLTYRKKIDGEMYDNVFAIDLCDLKLESKNA